MPRRWLREEILYSKPVNSLSEPAENFYRRLMSVVDDYGYEEADPEILKAKCFPLRPQLRATDISQRLTECETAGVILCFEDEHDHRRYLWFLKTDPPRAEHRKYPAHPLDKRNKGDPFPELARKCAHLRPYANAEAEAKTKTKIPIAAQSGEKRAKSAGKAGVPGHKSAVDAWQFAWSAAHHGAEYPFNSRAAKAVKDILEHFGARTDEAKALDRFNKLIATYLSTPPPAQMYSGHPLYRLADNLPEWIDRSHKSEPKNGAQGEHDDYPIPTRRLAEKTNPAGSGPGNGAVAG